MNLRTAVIISLILAIATSLMAWVPWGRYTSSADSSAETKVLLNASAGTDAIPPERVASLRVARWDPQDKAPKVFEVARRNSAWVIPSHFDYPADGGSRVGETAGGVLNVPRGPLVTSKREQHAELGVVDPLETAATAGDDARGQRVTLKDEGGAVLVDLIIGKPAAAAETRYVRHAGRDEVYTAKVNPDISTAFKDWVETDPLKINRGDVHHVGILDYSVDEARGAIDQRSSTVFRKEGEGFQLKWDSEQTPAGKRIKMASLESLLDEVTRLRLVGVRPFDPAWLQSRGFYVARRGPDEVDLVGNEGSLEIGTRDGLRYRLFFGEIAVGDEADTSATQPTSQPATQPGGSAPNRYMAVLVEYDPQFDRTGPAVPPLATAPATTQSTTGPSTQPAAPPQRPPPTTQQVETGRKLAAEKNRRFQAFFYVISDDSFKKMRPAPETLFEDASVSKDKLPGEKLADDAELTETPSGLQYADLKVGEGEAAADGDAVEVHYTGWLAADGTKFDSSLDKGQPYPVTVGSGGVIQGWDEGLVGMKVGGKRKLVIPPELGYGATGSPPDIPPDAQLVFDVELLKVQKPAKP